MEMKLNAQVLGAKGFKGTVEGQSFDSTRLYVVMECSDRNGTECGFNAVAIPFGKQDEFEKIKKLPFPVNAELTINMTTKGMECVGFKAVKVGG